MINNINEFYIYLKKFDYGILTKTKKKITNLDNINFFKEYRTISPIDFQTYKIGVCWDFVEYTAWYFSKYFKNYKYKMYFIQCNNEDKSTHTWFSFQDHNKIKVLECAWGDYQGIHEYNNESEMLSDYIRKHCSWYKNNEYIVYEYKPFDIYGLNCVEYMDYIYNNGKLVKSNFNSNESSELILSEGKITENIVNIFNGIDLDLDKKIFIIKRISFNQLLERIKHLTNSRKIVNLFDKDYSKLSEILFNADKIKRSDMKIISLKCHLFFALEMYNLFMALYDEYDLYYYKSVAKKIYNKTWISNFEKVKKTELDTSYLNNLRFKAKNYQLEFIKNYKYLKEKYDLEGYILSFEQGLGKTFTAIGLYECLHNIDQIIIVCPNTLKENWSYEIKEYYPEYYNNDKKWKNEVFVHGVSGYNITKDTKFIIVNNEAIPKIYDYCKDNNVMIIVDESHNFRNSKGKHVGELLKLKEITKCKDNLIMSGTPIKATPDELIPALRMIDPYFTEELSIIYKRAFAINNTTVSRIVKDRFNRTIYRRTKKQVLRLPKKNIENIFFEIDNPNIYTVSYLKKEIRKLYYEIYNEKLKDLEFEKYRFEILVKKYSSASSSLTKDYLNWINSITDPDEETIEIYEHKREIYESFLDKYVFPNIKDQQEYNELKKLNSIYINKSKSAMGTAIGKILPKARNECYKEIFLQNKDYFINAILNNPRKTILFTPFLPVAKFLSNELTNSDIDNVLIVGETNNRMDLINQFKYSDNVNTLIATTQTLSTGVTLTEANQMFFFGTPYRSADFDQACDRIHRIGQISDVNIYINLLKSEKPNITERISDILAWSDEMFESLIDGKE